jgi:3-deoxy-D-manno-octulosonic-acid transferase
MPYAYYGAFRSEAEGKQRAALPGLPSALHSRSSFMLWLYRLLFLPVFLLVAPFYLRRMRRRGGYGEKFSHRFGGHLVPDRRAGVKRIWLQAVSVGEMLAIGPMLEALWSDGVEVYLTTTTSTGYRTAAGRYRMLALEIGYFPIDWWLCSARAWRRIDPDLVILTEGERWPEHLHQARCRGVPVICINGRISDRSFHRLRLIPPVARLMFDGITQMLPSSSQDEARFQTLGFPAARMRMVGNIKLDVAIPRLDAEALARLRGELGLPPGFVLLGSSTWSGEEAALIEALAHARKGGLQGSLLLVPRHAERRPEIEQLLRRTGLAFHFRTDGDAPAPVDVAVADTTGELRRLTQLADLVFVGKSLPPHTEGQTPVEAAALGKAILFGPGMGNFRQLAGELVARGAAQRVENERDLVGAVSALLQDNPRREALSAAAGAWQRDNAGAMERTLAVVREELAAR